MTAVGKILVFLNLVFSLVLTAFIVFIYAASTNWEKANKGLQAQVTVLSNSAETYRSEAEKAQKDADAKVGKMQGELDNALKDNVSLKREIGQLRDDLAKLRQKSDQQMALASRSGAEVEKRQEDVAKLRDVLRKAEQNVNDLVKKNAELVQEATVAKIDARSVQDRNNRLEAQLQEKEKELKRISAGGAGAAVRAGSKNPPPDNVEGLVKNTDSSGLMTITIGSDAGLAKGHTLELFSLNPAKYKGTVRVLEADARQAVVQPVGRLIAPPQPGDRVASRILGGS
jgi:hypothetical protein